jgi:hypothetical protein
LFEGTWQKYHYDNATRSEKFLELAERAATLVMTTPTAPLPAYTFSSDFRSLFTSDNLASNTEVILYRSYGNFKHAQTSASNGDMAQPNSANLALVKSFICSDGQDWETSSDPTHKDFTLANLIRTRDSRFEATFCDRLNFKALASYFYISKFAPRNIQTLYGKDIPVEFTSALNETDYPVMRYAEVVLNWIEAKAERGNLTQADIDRSINAIRSRPIHADASARGVQPTAPLDLANLPDTDAIRDIASAVLWEIRRERRMEFAFEYSRLIDLKRWAKLEYMDTDKNPDLLRGAWITLDDISMMEITEMLTAWKTDLVDRIGVVDLSGNLTIFDGSNTGMSGFLHTVSIIGRLPFLNLQTSNPYLAPVGRNQRIDYRNRGYELAQTEGWPSDL